MTSWLKQLRIIIKEVNKMENYCYRHEKTEAMLHIPAKNEIEAAKILRDLVFLTGMWRKVKVAKEEE